MKNKKKPSNYLNYTIVAWFFAIAAIIFITVPLILHLVKWSGYIWILFFLSGLGFACLGVSIGMVITLHTVKDKSIKEEREFDLLDEKENNQDDDNK